MADVQLLKQQIEKYKARLAVLEKEYDMMLDQKEIDTIPTGYSNNEFTNIDNNNFKYDVEKKLQEIKELRKILENCVEIAEVNSDVIVVGSRFSAIIDDDEEAEDYMLLDSYDYQEAGLSIVTTKSPFGKAVIGKGANSSFSYEVNGNTINGKIVGIKKAKQKVKA